MNKTIKLTQEIKDSNVLLNKFILFHYKDNSLLLWCIYKINDSNNIFVYNISYNNKRKVFQSDFRTLNLHIVNYHISKSLKDYCDYRMYII